MGTVYIMFSVCLFDLLVLERCLGARDSSGVALTSEVGVGVMILLGVKGGLVATYGFVAGV